MRSWQKHRRCRGLRPNAIRDRELDGHRRKELLSTLAIYATLIDKQLDILSIIRREEMHESGYAQQLVLGGEVVRARKDIVKFVTARFKRKDKAAIAEALESLMQLEQLDDLVTLAATAKRYAQFRKTLDEAQPKT